MTWGAVAGERTWPVAAMRDARHSASLVEQDDRPTLLVAGPVATRDGLAGWAEQAGLRCIGAVAPDMLARRLAMTIAVDLILLDLRGETLRPGDARALAARRELPGSRLAVLTDLQGVDTAMALLGDPETRILCEPAAEDIQSLLVMAAIEAEKTARPPRLHDSARDDATLIEQLSEEVRRLARTIERLTQHNEARTSEGAVPLRAGYRGMPGIAEDRMNEPPRGYESAPDQAGAATPGEIRALLRARRLREQFLPPDLFADPAWDMILDLMAARLSGQRVSVSSLCIAAAVPPTTALRWIRQLTDRGVFARIDDPADGRRVFIEITDEAAEAFIGWTSAVRRNGGLLQPANGR
ncbi:MAG: MarR family transcriptional regulator [Sphingobium sp.]|nr:MarR family transcriptional regulator [Sphingobium sp.]